MPDENITDAGIGCDELPMPGETSRPATIDIEESKAIAIAALTRNDSKTAPSSAPQKLSDTGGNKEQRKAPRFRVRWQTHILLESESAHHGFIDDISTLGASVYLDSRLVPEKWTLLITVPPLSVTSKAHVIEVFGKLMYVVYDGNRQLYRAAVHFLQFNPPSNLTYLGERLAKYQLKIPEQS